MICIAIKVVDVYCFVLKWKNMKTYNSDQGFVKKCFAPALPHSVLFRVRICVFQAPPPPLQHKSGV